MKICVIGAGASGLICAGTASKNGHEVFLFEKNEKVGKKIYITGKGRCNVTNCCSTEDFLGNVISNPKFLMSSLYNFSTYDLMDLIENNGTKLKVERGNRVFPETDKSSDINKALSNYIKFNNVNLKLKTKVLSIIKNNNQFLVKTSNGDYTFDKVVISTGGLSYKSTGSTGDGYKFAKQFSHKIIDTTAGLSPILLKDNFCKEIEGLSLKNVNLNIYKNNNLICDEFGEMMFTDKGITGPIVLSLSSKINRLNFNDLKMYLDFKPALSNEKLNNRLLREFETNLNKNLDNILTNLLPRKFVEVFLKVSNINGNVKANSITTSMRNKLIEYMKNFPLHILKIGIIDNAIITSGGVCAKEINPKTMESKLVKNLYFCGEVIDVDALTGGYNLQIAFSTGYSAGNNL